MTRTIVEFTADDRYGLWKQGDLAVDLGRESEHPDAPPIQLLRLLRDGQILALTDPYGRRLIRGDAS